MSKSLKYRDREIVKSRNVDCREIDKKNLKNFKVEI